MKLPRDLGGSELAKILSKYGFQVTRQTGSHLRLTSTIRGERHLTIPMHKPLRIGTLSSILSDVAAYLERDKQTIIEELFGGSK